MRSEDGVRWQVGCFARLNGGKTRESANSCTRVYVNINVSVLYIATKQHMARLLYLEQAGPDRA